MPLLAAECFWIFEAEFAFSHDVFKLLLKTTRGLLPVLKCETTTSADVHHLPVLSQKNAQTGIMLLCDVLGHDFDQDGASDDITARTSGSGGISVWA